MRYETLLEIDEKVPETLEWLRLLVPTIPTSPTEALYELRQELAQVFDQWERIRCSVDNAETFEKVDHLCNIADNMFCLLDLTLATNVDPPSSVSTDLE